MKKSFVFLNGNFSDFLLLRRKIKKDDFLIGVDGGIRHIIKLGLKPDLVIGDMDSLTEEEKEFIDKESIKTIVYSTEKNFTDSELGIKYAIDKGYKRIIVGGFLGKRVDHLLSNVMFLANFSKLGIKISVIEGNQEIFIVKKGLSLSVQKKDIVSLVPLRKNCLGVKTKGLKWELKNETLYFGKGRGVSNVALKNKISIVFKEGVLMVVLTKLS